MSWINKLDYQQSIKEIREEEKRGKDFCLDPLRFEDLSIPEISGAIESEVIEIIEKRIFSPLIEIESPKANYILRPCGRPSLIEWIAYNSIVNFIGSKIYKQIPDVSFSFARFKSKFKKKYKKNIDFWLDFENESLKFSQKNKFLLVTDIVSFFENISVDVLRERLLILSEDKDYQSAVNFLTKNILSNWTQKDKVQGFGLPQGPTASTILADVYLYSVDREMRKNQIPFFRYMDDIRVYSKTRQELKKSMMVLVRSLRDLKLNLSAKKTFIYETNEQKDMQKVFDPKRETLNLIDKAFYSKKKDQVKLVCPALLELYELSKDHDNSFDMRYFRFFISHIIDLMRFDFVKKTYIEKLTAELLSDFKEKHHLSDKICWFFTAASLYDEKIGEIIKTGLINFIADKENNIYDWQEMWALDTIRQIGNLNKLELNKLIKYSSKHPLCQAQLCLISSQNGSVDTHEESLDKILKSQLNGDQYRYYYLASQELHKDLLKKADGKVPPYFLSFIANLKGKKYGYKYFLGDIKLISDYPEYQ